MGLDRMDICPQHAFPAHGVDQPELHAGQFNVRREQVNALTDVYKRQGEWVEFPVTNEEMQEVFRRIGIGRRYEEWFITDYDCPDATIGKVLGAVSYTHLS